MIRSILSGLAAALALWCALPAEAQTPNTPIFDDQHGPTIADPNGAIASTDQAEICRVDMGADPRDGHYGRLSYSVRNRMPEEQSEAIKRAWLPAGTRLAAWELDHRLPLCLGGSNDPANLWMQPIAEARVKDELEAEACRRVCRGALPLAEAQGWFTDWKASYLTVFGHQP